MISTRTSLDVSLTPDLSRFMDATAASGRDRSDRKVVHAGPHLPERAKPLDGTVAHELPQGR